MLCIVHPNVPVVKFISNPNFRGKVFSWLTGKNQKPTANGALNGNGNSDGGGGAVAEVDGNTLNRIVVEEPDADLNF